MYFETNTANGFTARIYYEEENGVISITDIQIQSKTYGGPTWYLGGEIKIDGTTVLSMSYKNPATHAVNVFSAGESWIPIQVVNGTALPVSSGLIVGKTSVDITVNIELYRDGSSPTPDLSGSVTVSVSAGFVYIDSGSGFEAYECYIDNGTSWDRYIPYVDNGSSWDMCN